ncbi:MAG TPA: response regulator, partial [Burkholderiaceae bacterium]|nr:response regulator [Burkholderiaceae bacterium]
DASNGTVSFAIGETSKTISITVNGDALDEDAESFQIVLSGAVNAVIADAIGVGTISNDDTAPTIVINSVSVTEGATGVRPATFTATLPRVEPPPAADARADPGAVARLRPGREVLVVEDHADTLDMLVSALDGSGWSVVVARTFADAVARLDGLREPALVSDLGLLDGSGHDVVRRFRERHAGPAIAVSGYGTEADVAASLAAGFDAHLVKPIDPDRLERLLGELDAKRGRLA